MASIERRERGLSIGGLQVDVKLPAPLNVGGLRLEVPA